MTLLRKVNLPDGTARPAGRSILVAWGPESCVARWLTEDMRAALGG